MFARRKSLSLSSCFVVVRFFIGHFWSWRQFGYFWLSFFSSPSQSKVSCMPVSPLPFKGRILPCNPSQLWQIARPIKEKLFGSPQTRWPHVAARPPLRSSLHLPPWDLTSEGPGVTALVVSSATEREGKHRNCKKTGQLAPALTERLFRGHRGYVPRPHLQ